MHWEKGFLFLQIISLNGSRKYILSNGGCCKSITLDYGGLLETVLDSTTDATRIFRFRSQSYIDIFLIAFEHICGKMNAKRPIYMELWIENRACYYFRGFYLPIIDNNQSFILKWWD